jgi:hypothetical protein
MRTKRKITLAVKKVCFSEAEEANDKYWAKASVDERVQELITLKKIGF